MDFGTLGFWPILQMPANQTVLIWNAQVIFISARKNTLSKLNLISFSLTKIKEDTEIKFYQPENSIHLHNSFQISFDCKIQELVRACKRRKRKIYWRICNKLEQGKNVEIFTKKRKMQMKYTKTYYVMQKTWRRPVDCVLS